MTIFNNNKKPRSDDGDDDFDFTPVAMFNDPIKVNDVDAYIDQEIGAPAKYRNMLHYLRTMDEYDRIRIWINSPGGRLDSTLDIIDSIANAKGDVTVIVTGMAGSAASIIALQAPKLVLGERGFFFCHNGSFGAVGKVHEVASQVKHTEREFEKLIRETYKHFMTEEEIQSCIDGKDFWFDNEESKRRLEVRHSSQEQALKKAKRVARKVTPSE